MENRAEVERIEQEIAQDEARLREIDEAEKALLENIPHHGFQTATAVKNLQSERSMLGERLFHNRQLLSMTKSSRS